MQDLANRRYKSLTRRPVVASAQTASLSSWCSRRAYPPGRAFSDKPYLFSRRSATARYSETDCPPSSMISSSAPTMGMTPRSSMKASRSSQNSSTSKGDVMLLPLSDSQVPCLHYEFSSLKPGTVQVSVGSIQSQAKEPSTEVDWPSENIGSGLCCSCLGIVYRKKNAGELRNCPAWLSKRSFHRLFLD